MTDEHANLAQRVESLKKEVVRLETDNEILVRKFESEKEILADGKRSELLKSKEKTHKSKHQLNKAQLRIKELEEDLARAAEEKERGKSAEESFNEARDQM